MQTTPNLGLKKPDLTDNVLVSDLNENADVIDAAVKENSDSLTTHLAEIATDTELGHIRLSDIPSPTKTSIGLGNVDNVQQLPLSQKGVANGVAPLGADNKVPLANLPGLGSLTLIQSIAPTSGGTVSFLSIPQTYKHLELIVSGYVTSTDFDVTGLDITINKDNTAKYSWQILQVNESGVSSNAQLVNTNKIINTIAIITTKSGSNRHNKAKLNLLHYASNKEKFVRVESYMNRGVVNSANITTSIAEYQSNNAITDITLSLVGVSMSLGTLIFELYGVN